MIGRDTLTRARLLDRLGYRRPLTLVVAPAGYGKTTLVVDWLEHAGSPFAWLSLDAHDNSLGGFMIHFLAALGTLFGDACPETRALLNGPSLPPPSAIAHALVNELEALAQPFILVLDDYNVVEDLAVHQVMAELLHYRPHTLELVVIARHDPPLPLPAMRARNWITEIRAEELRFSHEEAKWFLQERSGLLVEEEQVAALERMTEGWAAGLRMAALFIQQQGDVAEISPYLNRSGRFAIEFLANEVVEQLAPHLREFLVRTAFMEQVCAPLCAAVLDDGTAAGQCQTYLDLLAQSNLFVFHLHGEGGWFHYHHLLRMMLQHIAERTMTAAQRALLHARASRWLEADGQIDTAIGHAVAAGDVQAVAGLVRRHRQELFNNDRWAGLETWRHLIPRAMIEQHPQLLILDAWSLSHQALVPELARRLDALDALIAATPMPEDELTTLRSEVDALHAQPLFWAGDVERCVESARRSLATAPADHYYVRAFAWLYMTLSLDMTNRAEEASAALDEALHQGNRREGSYPTFFHITACFLLWQRADMVGLEEATTHMLALAQEHGRLESITWARYFRGCARYQQNDLPGAERDFAAVANMAYIAHPLPYSQSLIGLAATYQAQGEFDKAYESAAQGWLRLRESDYAAGAARAEGYLAHLALRQGRIEEAMAWVAQPSRISAATPMPTFHATAIGRAGILLGLGTPEAQAEAAELLAELRVHVERLHNTRFLIEVLALQALALASAGEQEGALDLLERAVQLTVPGGAIRALADLDFQIGALLEQLAKRSALRSQIALIRRAALVFRPPAPPERGASAEADRERAAPTLPPRAHHPDLLETLTLREMDVMLLLLERLSNKEIAQQLNISAETVKRHLANIFDKLHVENRRQAIVQARAMGIVAPK